jgi:hypothetical protein
MTNWKSKYLEMKLKYINAKQNGGALDSDINPAMKTAIDDLAKEIRRTHNLAEMTQMINMMNINSTFQKYVKNNQNAVYCLILLRYVRNEIKNTHNLAFPPAYDNGNGGIILYKVIPHLIATSTVYTPTEILEDILTTLHYADMPRETTIIALAAQIANLIKNHNANIVPVDITSDTNIWNYRAREQRGIVYAQLQYIHQIPIYNYFLNETLANMPTTPVIDDNGNHVINVHMFPNPANYATYPNPDQAYADAVLQYEMQMHKLQLNIRRSIFLGAPDPNASGIPGSPLFNINKIKKMSNNYVNYYNP